MRTHRIETCLKIVAMLVALSTAGSLGAPGQEKVQRKNGNLQFERDLIQRGSGDESHWWARPPWNEPDRFTAKCMGPGVQNAGFGVVASLAKFASHDRPFVKRITDMEMNLAMSWEFIAHFDFAELGAGEWDVYVLGPYRAWDPSVNGPHWTSKAKETDAACRCYRLALYGNPDIRMYLWQHPVFEHRDPGKQLLEDAAKLAKWREQMKARCLVPDDPQEAIATATARCEQNRAFIRELADAMTEVYGRPPRQQVCIMPTAAAELELLKQVVAGQVPGLTDHKQIYTQRIENAKAAATVVHYLDGLVQYAAMRGQSPMALFAKAPKPEADNPQRELDLLLQRIAWYALVTDPYSGVEVSAEKTPPPAPGKVQVSSGDAGEAIVTWDEGQDAASSVCKYIVTRGDGKTFETFLPRLLDRQPLAAATYRVAAVNCQGVDDSGKQVWQVAKRPQVTPKTRWPDAKYSGKIAAPPGLKRVIAHEDPNAVLVEFSQPVDKAAGMNRANYRINGDVNIHAVCAGPSPATFVLKTSPLVKGRQHRLSVAGSAAVEFDLKTTDWKVVDRDLQFSIAAVEHGGRCLNLNGNGYGMRSPRELRDARFEVPEGNEFVALVRDDLKGDFDFRIRVLNLQKGGKIGIVAANDVQNPAKGGFGYLALARGRGQETGGFEAGYVAAKADAVPGEINTRQRVPHPSGLSNPTPLWTCWLRLKRKGNIFSAYYFTTQDFDTYYTERPVEDEEWVLLKTFETLGTANCPQVGVFATSGTPGDTGENHVAVQVGPLSWATDE